MDILSVVIAGDIGRCPAWQIVTKLNSLSLLDFHEAGPIGCRDLIADAKSVDDAGLS